MTTTALFAEILVSGVEALVWMMLLVITLLPSSTKWLTSDDVKS